MTRPIRFGIQLSTPLPDMTWADTARAVEGAGFSTLVMPDHFTDQLAPIAALSVAAAVTTELRVGALVFANDYRHPVVLGKEMATLDVLSNGRVEWGIGAGWMRTDYEQSGMDYDRPGLRIERLAEAVDIIKACFADGEVAADGEHYSVTGYTGLPKPVQAGGPPLLIGGGGPRMLAYAAQVADIIGINPNMKAGEVGPDAIADAMAPRFEEKIGWVREAAGDRFDQIELNTMCMTTFTDDRASTMAGVGELFGVDASAIEQSPFVQIGTAAQIAEDLLATRERSDSATSSSTTAPISTPSRRLSRSYRAARTRAQLSAAASTPMLVLSPWPVCTVVCSGSMNSFDLIESTIRS